LPALERGSAVEIEIMGMDELTLELDCRYLQSIEAQP